MASPVYFRIGPAGFWVTSCDSKYPNLQKRASNEKKCDHAIELQKKRGRQVLQPQGGVGHCGKFILIAAFRTEFVLVLKS